MFKTDHILDLIYMCGCTLPCARKTEIVCVCVRARVKEIEGGCNSIQQPLS